jgi:LuxR family maltose regulon positive regulatory protein
MVETHFQLKTAPPRFGRAAPVRKRLEQRWAEVHDRTAIIVTAPQGFGKTTLLAQWRRNWLERGAFVAWASLDAQDDRARFVDLLLFALRLATGRESFAKAATQSGLEANRELDALTALLAEVAVLATPTVVILDDAHRMPQATMRELLGYLLNNAPPNLQFLVGTRRPLELPLTDLMAAGRVGAIDGRDLRLSVDESLGVLRARFANRIGLDDAVRLHELTEGWPLGLQLAASTVERAADLHEVIGQLSARRGDIQRFFFESLMSQLTPDEVAFLVRVSILEVLNADVCEAVTGDPQSARYLESLTHESPIVTEGEGRNWLRLHSMARDFLLGQFDRLAAAERRGYYERAAAWYAEHGHFQDAARQALAAGDDALAVDHASRCLLDIAREGRLAEAREWMKRLPVSSMSRDIRLQLTAAWITALSNEAPTVPGLIEDIARHPQFDEGFRFQAAVIAATAAIFCDKPGLVADALRSWESAPPGAPPLHVVSLVNAHATLDLHAGDNEQIRRRLGSYMSGAPHEAGMRLPLGFADLLFGLSYLMEGNAAKAISVLQPKLELAELEMGRRSTVAAMLAGPLAAAYFACDAPEHALATLADRLDVIERVGMPDPIILAYRALAGVAMRRGEEALALEFLVGLYELGISRNLPRVLFNSLAEQIRFHSLQGRGETATELLERFDALGPVFEQPDNRPFLWLFRRTRAVSAAYAHLARSDLEGAEIALRAATDMPPGTRRSPSALVARALLAMVVHERGDMEGRAMLAEVLGLADLAGIRSFIEAAHPRLAAILVDGVATGRAADATRADTTVRAPAPAHSAAPAAAGGLLTPREARILSLLAQGRANKEIARAMDIGEQTVKWHLKNVFFKLNAASRKHAVDRARLLGLLVA